MRYLKKKRVENAGNPKGFWGVHTMRAMNKSHDELTDWGLSFLTVNDDDKICGGGRTLKKLSKATTNTVWGVDISDTAIKESFRMNRADIKRDHVMICKSGVSDLPFADGTSVHASGYGCFPNNYGDASDAIDAHFMQLLPEDMRDW